MKYTDIPKQILQVIAIISLTSLMFACSQSNSNTPVEDAIDQTAECVTQDDPSGSNNCGELLLGITDADGDFVTYTVDITSISMTRRDGTQVNLLPTTQRIDFTEYVELSELITAATVPTGVYTSGSITLDYTSADIQVEKEGVNVPATMVDELGNPVTELTLEINLDNREQLVISRVSPAFLELDFNLLASHTVDLSTDPATVTTEPFISAEIAPVIEKEFRLRGPLIRVNEEDSFYRIAVRPFYDRTNRHGGVNIFIDEATEFMINETAFTGEAGLTELANQEQATATVAFGVFNREERKFTASRVLAGSSVPGFDKDAVKGIVIARAGNQLEVHGATLIRTSGPSLFRGIISVTVADETQVFKQRDMDAEVDINDISVGQAVTILGTVTSDDSASSSATMDATDGAVKMRLTSVSGTVNESQSGQVTVDLQSINGRPASVFDFTGTGVDSTFDADPQNYEINTNQLTIDELSNNTPIRARGFVAEFGTAPDDFNALSIIDYSEVRSELAVSWTEDATDALAELTSESMVLNMSSEQLGALHHLKQAGIRVDLSDLDQNVTIIPHPALERGAYGVVHDGSLSMFTHFADFSTFLQQKLDEGETIKLVHGNGGYDSSNNQLSAYKIAIVLH